MPEFDTLLELSDLDTHIDQLRHRRSHDPLHAELAAAGESVAAVDTEADGVRASRHEVRREQSRLEDEVSSFEAKIAKFDAQLYDGSVTGPKELESIQVEIAHLNDRKSQIEDSVIEQMERAEPLDATISELEARRAGLEGEREEVERRLTVLTAEIDAELETLAAQRIDLLARLDADLVATYESLRERLVPAATRLAAGGRCEGCHLTLPRVDYDTIKRAPADETVYCPECGRILVR